MSGLVKDIMTLRDRLLTFIAFRHASVCGNGGYLGILST